MHFLLSCLMILLVLTSCQTPQNQTLTHPETETVAQLTPNNSEQPKSSEQSERPSFAALDKPAPTGLVSLDGNTLTVSLQIPALDPVAFKTQLLDLGTASKILATVKDSYGKSYQPVGADGNGRVNYPVSGVVSLTFNNVTPDNLLLVELKVLDTGLTDIPQADLAVALRHTGVNNPAAVNINFQTGAVAKTLKELLALNANRARTVDLSQLNTLMGTITGQGGTAPNFTYSQVHPTLVRISTLAGALVSSNPTALTASDYRATGATVNLTVNGLLTGDRLQVQVTDAASVVKTNLGNGSGGATYASSKATPGSNLKVKVSAFGTPSVSYSYSASPSTLTLTEGGNHAVTITAAPNLTLTNFSPTSGPATTTSVIITGTGFTGASAVTFNGAAAAFTVNSNTQITATVPTTAADGPISVTNGTTVSSVGNFDVHRRIYVRASAVGSNNGTSWADAYTSLKNALDASGANDELWVASSIYKPDLSNVNTTFTIKSNVDVYGGFAGNEATLAARNPATNLTTLSGDLQNDDNTGVTPFTSATANTNTLIMVTSNTILDGFTVRGASNGAMRFNSGSGIQLKNMTFQHNKSTDDGGAINYSNTGALTIDSSTFSRNVATNRGGALFGANNLTITNTTLNNNVAADGGALYLSGNWDLVTNNVTWHQNSASATAGAAYLFANRTINLNNNVFSNNTSFTNGSAIYHYTGIGTITNTVFRDNTGARAPIFGQNLGGANYDNVRFINNGGVMAAMHVDTMDGTFNLNKIAMLDSNRGSDALMYFNAYNPSNTPLSLNITNSLVANNTMGIQNGTIRIGGVAASYVSAALRNITLANNVCESGRCTLSTVIPSRVTYHNLLLWKDVISAGGHQPAGTLAGNVDLGTGGAPFVSPADPDGADNILFTADDGFRLNATATAAFNAGITGAGIPLTDSTGQTRIDNPEPGAYEYLGSVASLPANVIAVDKDATGANNGSSWANAYTSLKTALDAGTTTSGKEIWIAAGTYTPGTPNTNSFQMKDGVSIYGGFAGTEDTRSARNPVSNVVILSGDLSNNDNYAADPFGNISENSLTVVKGAGSASTVLDGVTIKGGNNTLGNPGGGGMLIDGASPTINNVIFRENSVSGNGAGLSIRTAGASPTLSNVTFYKNRSTSLGGGIDARNGSSPTLTDVTFRENRGSSGGGMSASNSTPNLLRVSFVNNTGTSNGGGYYNSGASTSTLKNVVFANNSTTGSVGSGMGFGGGLAQLVSGSTLNLYNVTFSNNTSTNTGTGLYLDTPSSGTHSLTQRNVLYWNNTQSGPGTALGTGNGNVSLTGSAGSANDPFRNSLDPENNGLWIKNSPPASVLNTGVSTATNSNVPTTDILNRGRQGNPEPGAYEYYAY